MGKKKFKWWIVVVAAVVVAAAILLTVVLLSKKKDTYRVVKVYEVEGTAYVQRDGIDDLEPYANMLLKSGDTVRVDTGSMTLKLDEDKYIYVEPDTEFSLVAEGSGADSRTTIELKKGAITNEIQDKLSTDSSYEVNTPNATMAVRGTIFRVEITYDENGVCYTKVSTLEGKVVSRLVYADGTISENEVPVEQGYEVIIYQDDKNTDYLGDVTPIDFSKLPESLRERFADLIEEIKEKLGIETESSTTGEDQKESSYTVTFLYKGTVFGTQTVQAGACAVEPTLMPEANGSWDYDFTKPVEADITIEWK